MQKKNFINEIDLNNFIDENDFIYSKKIKIKKRLKTIFELEYITMNYYNNKVNQLVKSFFDTYNISFQYNLIIKKEIINITFEAKNDKEKLILKEEQINNWKNILELYLENHIEYKPILNIYVIDSINYEINFPDYFEELKKILKEKKFEKYTTPYLNKKQREKIHSISYKFKNISSKSKGKGKIKKITITNKGYKHE